MDQLINEKLNGLINWTTEVSRRLETIGKVMVENTATMARDERQHKDHLDAADRRYSALRYELQLADHLGVKLFEKGWLPNVDDNDHLSEEVEHAVGAFMRERTERAAVLAAVLAEEEKEVPRESDSSNGA